MELTITVQAKGSGFNLGVYKVVPEPFTAAFQPLVAVDDPFMSAITGELMVGSSDLDIKLKLRKDAAEYIAAEIADVLVKEMKKFDTLNGYKIDEN